MNNTINICSVNEKVQKALKEFRFKKGKNTSALILKIEREKQEIILDEELDNITIDELQEHLQSHQPRYIILSYKRNHNDGRISFPLCFIYFTPRDSHRELQMMYAGSKSGLQREAGLPRSYEVRDLEDLTEQWLTEQLGG